MKGRVQRQHAPLADQTSLCTCFKAVPAATAVSAGCRHLLSSVQAEAGSEPPAAVLGLGAWQQAQHRRSVEHQVGAHALCDVNARLFRVPGATVLTKPASHSDQHSLRSARAAWIRVHALRSVPVRCCCLQETGLLWARSLRLYAVTLRAANNPCGRSRRSIQRRHRHHKAR